MFLFLTFSQAAPCVDTTPASHVVACSTPLLIEYPVLVEDVLHFVEDDNDVVFELDITYVKSYRTILNQVVRQIECDSANLDEVRSTVNIYGEPVILLDFTLCIPTYAAKLTVAILPAHEGAGHGIFRLPFGKKVAFEVVSHTIVEAYTQPQPEIPKSPTEDNSARFEWVEEGAWGLVIEDDGEFLDLDDDTESDGDSTDSSAAPSTPSIQHSPVTHAEPSVFDGLVEGSPVIGTDLFPVIDDSEPFHFIQSLCSSSL